MKATALILLATAVAAHAQQNGLRQGGAGSRAQSREPYYNYSETAPWYDSYGRLSHGYKDEPMRRYPPGMEPYYYYSERSPWYDSMGRLRYGPRATETKPQAPGKEPYYHYSESTPWYDSYGRLRYGPRGIPAE